MLPNHITKPTGSNAPGMGSTLYVAPIDWFLALQSPGAVSATPGDSVLIDTAHTFRVEDPTLGFVKIYCTTRTVEAMWEQVGDIDSEGINASVDAWSPGLNTALAEFMYMADSYVVLVPSIDCTSPEYIQLGNLCNPALKKGWKWKSGKGGGEGKKGFEIHFESYNDRPLIYTSTVTLAEQP